MSRVLTIAGASVRAAAQSAARAGFAVRACDLFADVDLAERCDATRVSDYPAELAAVVGGPQPGEWMYTGALENHPSLVRSMARSRTLLGNPAEVLLAVRDPRRVARVLHAAGIPCPRVVATAADVPRDGHWLRKPLHSAGGARIRVWRDGESHAGDSPRDFYYQQYVDGMACSAVYLGAGGRCTLLGTTRQLIGAAWTGGAGFRYCGSIGPLARSGAVAADFARIGDVLAAEFGLVGLFGVDAIANEQGVWPLEVNPRYTASVELLEWAAGIAAIDLHVNACQSGRLPDQQPPAGPQVCGKAIVFATEPAVVTSDLGQALGEIRPQTWPTLADIPQPGTRVKSGWPIATVLAQGADELQVLERLRERVAQVRAAVRTRVAP